jgi:hypothetical protein
MIHGLPSSPSHHFSTLLCTIVSALTTSTPGNPRNKTTGVGCYWQLTTHVATTRDATGSNHNIFIPRDAALMGGPTLVAKCMYNRGRGDTLMVGVVII